VLSPVIKSSISNILLIVNEEAHIRELSRVADLILQQGDMRPVVFIEDRLKHLGTPAIFVERSIEVLTSDGVAGGDGRAALGVQGRAFRRWKADLISGTKPFLHWILPNRFRKNTAVLQNDDLVLVQINRDLMLRRAAVSEAVFSQRSYSAVVISEDNVDLDTSVWIAIARKHNIRSIIVPYTISNTAEFAESFVHHPPFQIRANTPNMQVAKLFPEWVLEHKGQRFLRSAFSKIISVEQLGLLPPNPWLLNSGYADAIAVESRAMHDYYRAAGIPDKQLAMTGSLTDDVIASTIADAPRKCAELLQEHRLSGDKPLLLCALPPDQNTFDRPGCEFADFADLLDFWGMCLASVSDWNVIVRPHPKTVPEKLDALRRHGVTISYADTATLVPLCDLYVAAVSATIRWAIGCGKPVINYDVYQYGYQDYSGVEGVVLCNTRLEFRNLLTRLTTNAVDRATLAEVQRRDAPKWAILDGRSGQRMIALLRGDRQQPK
jgi:hypothetical protein